ncbi:MAG: glycine zipper 2TM domain-containing protein [Gammaproteobacteria bacterium]|nr:glycine zipper 2TM domain-containing protein [Gammaproteobacteria bacterium]
METQVKKSPHALLWITGIAVILFSATGIAAIMGWIPDSFGTPGSNAAPEISMNTTKPAAPQVHAHTTPAQVANNTSSMKCAECGVVESVREIVRSGEASGLGAAGGAIVGGALGSQVGGGKGKTAATVVGAVGGAVAGNMIERQVKSTAGYEITILLENGSRRVITVADAPTWRPGDHVKVTNDVIQSNS